MTMDHRLTARERDESSASWQPAVPVALREVSKLYRHGPGAVRALDRVSAEFARHSVTAVMGPSGSGKSTLLHCAAGLERPTSGTVWLAGQDLGQLSEKRLTRLRRSSVGFVFQAFNLVPALTVRENVVLPLRLAHARSTGGPSSFPSSRPALPFELACVMHAAVPANRGRGGGRSSR